MISCVEGIEHGERQLAEVSTRHSEVKRGRERSEAGSRRSENRRELGIGIGECGFKGEELGVRIQESGVRRKGKDIGMVNFLPLYEIFPA